MFTFWRGYIENKRYIVNLYFFMHLHVWVRNRVSLGILRRRKNLIGRK